jgi:hypothetical protein
VIHDVGGVNDDGDDNRSLHEDRSNFSNSVDPVWRRILKQFTASRTTLGPTQPPIQWVPGTLSLGVKRPGRETDHSHPSSAEVKECVELYLHSPNMPLWRST